MSLGMGPTSSHHLKGVAPGRILGSELGRQDCLRRGSECNTPAPFELGLPGRPLPSSKRIQKTALSETGWEMPIESCLCTFERPEHQAFERTQGITTAGKDDRLFLNTLGRSSISGFSHMPKIPSPNMINSMDPHIFPYFSLQMA